MELIKVVFVTDSGIVDLKITGVYQTQSQLTTLTWDNLIDLITEQNRTHQLRATQ